MSGVQIIEVDDDGQDQRLDRFLRRTFPELGQGRIEKMCRKGECRVDGSRVKASTRLSVGQTVRVHDRPREQQHDYVRNVLPRGPHDVIC